MKKVLSKLSPVIVIVGLLVIWEIIVRAFQLPVYLLPSPSVILKALINDISTLLYHSSVTVLEALIGMAISFAVAVVVGILMDMFPGFKRSIYPILVVTQTIPVIVLAPLLIIYMGFGWGPKILTVVLMCFFPIVVSFSDGLTQMDESYINLIRTYGGNKLQLYRIVKLPSAFISLISGLKVAATYSISGAVVGEWIASGSGLGYYLIRAKNNYLLDKVFASVVVIIILSLLMNGLVKLCGRLVLPSGAGLNPKKRRSLRKNLVTVRKES
ncbi:MAG: ABC transporter permease [Parasporobacterium sp.]|nr:ABC transporter permease [Parasporobacterium sp.]